MRSVTDDEKIVIGGNRNAWSARQLQRTLDGTANGRVEAIVMRPRVA